MPHPFPRHRTRVVHSLNGVWDLSVLGEVDPDTVEPGELVFDRVMAVPGVYDTLPDTAGMRGVVAVRTVLETEPGRRGRLCFGGLGLWARVYVDGLPLGDCHLPYSPWEVQVPPSDSSVREIVLLLDNRFGPERALLFDPFFDWYAHGGIYRDVVWHELPELAFRRATVSTTDLAKGEVSVRVFFDGVAPGSVDLEVAWDGGESSLLQGLPVEGNETVFKAVVPGARPWSPSSPQLHSLELRFPDGSDDLIERTGLRTVEAREGKVWLNGEPVEFRGVNRHEYNALAGPAQSDADRVHDVALLEDLGCNSVRGSHYQQNQHFLDLCDERGILVWEEALGWQARKEHFENPRFAELQEQALRTMIRASANHPSIICWGILNEGHSELPESKPVYDRLAKAAREEDRTRLITYACNHPFDCQNLHLCDLIAINAYPGWYAFDPDDPHPTGEIGPHLDKVLDHLHASGFEDVPKMISEIGAGALYGWRDRFHGHWSEEYQADYLSEVLRYMKAQPRWCGLTIWQFCDARTYNGSRAMGRPRAFNNKGLVDEYRRPKLAYETVKEAFRPDRGD